MIDWNPSEIETILGCHFEVPDQEEPFQFHEAFFDMGGIKYWLNICPVTEHVWMRADAADPNQATPHFEFSFRCDRIRIGVGGYDSTAVFFEFSNGDEGIDPRTHCRLMLDRLPSGNLYTWPVVGVGDPPLEVGRLSRTRAQGEQAEDAKSDHASS